MKKQPLIIAVSLLLLVIFAVSAFFIIPAIRKNLYPREYSEFVTKYSAEYGVPEPLVYAVIYTESGFQPDAVSYAGAQGLMQLMPDTYDWLSRLIDEPESAENIMNPETNIKYGTYYLSNLYSRFGDWNTAVAAYNAGHGRVGNWLKDSRYSSDGKTLCDIPLEETSNYVNKVNDAYDWYKEIYYKEGN